VIARHTNNARLQVLYVSELAEPAEVDLSVYEGLADGEDDIAWFTARLTELGIATAVEIHGVQVCLGQAIPPIEMFDAAVIGGSYHMVSDDRPWQRRLLRWMDSALRGGRPCLGICGGHQLMAAFFGAKVRPVPDGVWCETRAVNRTDVGHCHWLFRNLDPAVEFHFANYEHVVEVPDQAAALATRPSSPAVALDYGGNWVSAQFHPEMSSEAMARSWLPDYPDRARRYRPSPNASRILYNFLVHAGLVIPQVASHNGQG